MPREEAGGKRYNDSAWAAEQIATGLAIVRGLRAEDQQFLPRAILIVVPQTELVRAAEELRATGYARSQVKHWMIGDPWLRISSKVLGQGRVKDTLRKALLMGLRERGLSAVAPDAKQDFQRQWRGQTALLFGLFILLIPAVLLMTGGVLGLLHGVGGLVGVVLLVVGSGILVWTIHGISTGLRNKREIQEVMNILDACARGASLRDMISSDGKIVDEQGA